MKKLFFLFILLFATGVSLPLFAQEDGDGDDAGEEKIRDKMSEYIQKRLDLTKEEKEKFAPIFIRYFQEWRQTLRESRGLPKLDREQKIVNLRVRFRTEFKNVIGEARSNQVFGHQDVFVREIIRLKREQNIRNPKRPLRRPGVNRLLQI